MSHSTRRPLGRFVALFVATVAAFGLSQTLAATAQAVPSTFWGVAPQATPTLDQMHRLKRGGVDSIRIPIIWGAVQHQRGQELDFTATDEMIGNASIAGIEVLPFVSGAPAWAIKTNPRWHSPVSLPVRTGAQKNAWRNLLRGAALRYGPNGSFWADNPGVPKRPIRNWQIWNEANFMYFVAQPNPAEYGKLVVNSFAALRSVDPGAKIILGGLFSRPWEATLKRKPKIAYYASEFLDLMYKQTPGIKSKFHGVALHPYTSTYKRLTGYTEEFRRVLKAHRDTGKGLWITELGWSSQPPAPNNSFAKGRQGQVTELKGAFGIFKRNQAKWRVQRIYWFSVDDQAGTCNFCNGTGLFSEGFVPKPSWSAYVKFAGGRAN